MRTIELGADDVIGPGGGWLYESPLWDHRRNVFLWADIEAGVVHEFDPQTGDSSVHSVADVVACVALRAGAGYVLALRHAIAVADEAFTRVDQVHNLAELPDDVRFNDGAVAPDGAFWAGTLSHDRPGAGVLYRIGPDHTVSAALDGVSISNGMDWSADASDHYYVDSTPGTIDILQLAESAGSWSVVERTPFYRTSPEQGSPDGLAIDAEGHVWVALWGAGRVIRLTPAGEIVAEVRVPAPNTSSLAFGGDDLCDLYITTAREDLDAETLEAFPLSGSVFRWRGDIAGRRMPEWRG